MRDALAQLLYYEAFALPVTGMGVVRKVACFESKISEAHREWLNHSNIAVIWLEDGRFVGDGLAVEYLGDYIEEIG